MEKLVEFLHAALLHLSLAQLRAESHVCEFRFLFLHLEKTGLDGILNNELHSGHGLGLSEAMLEKCG